MNIRPTKAVIDLDAIAHNFRVLKSLAKDGAKTMAIVKANAYGNGAVPVSRVLENQGADWFGTALAEEAIELREAGTKLPILVLGVVPKSGAFKVVENNITVSLCGLENALALNQAAEQLGVKAKAHLKIDTGMGRIGLLPENVLPFIQEVSKLKNLEIKGMFSHFASADEADKPATPNQLKRFQDVAQSLEQAGFPMELKHCSNSAATIMLPQAHYDMVRPGIALYGVHPCDDEKPQVDLKQSMTLKTAIVLVKDVKKGEPISYGGTYVPEKDIKVGVLPIGYADGYPRLMSNQGQVLVHGKRVPVLGRVCMDMTMINVSGIKDVQVGDEVVLFGSQEKGFIPLSEIAKKAGTICHEIMCGITKRVPRFYQ